MAGDAEDTDSEIDVAARMADDPDLPYKGLLRHYQPSKPFIAAVEGVAIAGGTELLQGTDIRVAGESARFGVSEARWSLYPMARIGRPPAPADPLHARGGDPAHRQAHHRRGSGPHRADRSRRARRSGAHQGARRSRRRSTTTVRSRSRRSCARCARPTA